MSWFAKSLATLKLDDDDSSSSQPNHTTESPTHPNSNPTDSDSSNRGVKEDLSEITKTLTRNFWGVASFLAPPPPSSSDSDPSGSDPDESDSPLIPNIRNDFAEIGGKFRSGISKISNNMAVVSEITTKMASNFLQLGVEGEEERDYYEFGAVGVTDRVVDFVRDVVMHPETWLDFPLPDNDDEEDFDMSDAQQEHALAVERLVPRLAALRMELCPGYMSETCFWKIYFVLLHPRLDQHDAEVLSTPQIVKARSLLTQNNLRNHTSANPEQDYSSRDTPSIEEDMKPPAEEFLSAPSASQMKSVPSNISALESAPQEADIETEKHPVSVNEVQIVDKSVIKEENVVQNKKQNLPSISSSKVLGETDEDDADSSDEDAMSEDGSEDNEDNKSALDEVTPEQVKSSQKKRASVSTSKKHVPEKKANLITPEKTNGKKGSVTLLCCLGNVKQLFEGKREMYLGDKKMKIKITIQRIFDKLYLVLPNTTISVEAVKERNALWKIFLLEAKSTCIGGPLYALKCSVTKDFNQTATRAPPTLVTDPRNVTRPVDDWELLVLLHLYTSLTLQMMQFGVALTQDYMSSESIRASFMFLSSGQYAYDHVALLHQKEVWANYAKTFLSTSLRTRMVSRRGVCHD